MRWISHCKASQPRANQIDTECIAGTMIRLALTRVTEQVSLPNKCSNPSSHLSRQVGRI